MSTDHMPTDLSRRVVIGAVAVGVAALGTGSGAQVRPANAETIAIIGTGNVGGTLGKRWAALGHAITYGSRAPDSDKVKQLVEDTGLNARATTQADAVKGASVVLLAAPSQMALDIVNGLGDLSGKLVIDAMNAMSFKDGAMIEPDDALGLAARIQAAAPEAAVIKAFNTTTTRIMADPKISGGPVSLPIAGGDASARARVSALAAPLGFEVVDMGGSEALKQVEHLGRIYVAYAVKHRPQRLEFHLRTWKA
ncbi:MAG: NAD(P)-binding domain-containing protein [Rhodospirillaceae bacterium]|nr:NAD(P)-binding domain-containing protein [Rhodospirillaceae bacterium]